jgi:uncharacterized protein (TIGR02246 family)
MAISFALPTFAQPKDANGARIVQQRDLLGVPDAVAGFDELHHKLEEVYNKNDAAAVVALFTEDAVLVTADGVFSGRQNIEKRYAEAFQRSPITEFVCSWERYHLNAIDNAAWSARRMAECFSKPDGSRVCLGLLVSALHSWR